MPKPHVVKEGEYLALIARKNRFVTTKALLDANPELFAKRRRDDILNPGDVVVIPDKRVKLVPRATGQSHSFQLAKQEIWLRLLLQDAEGHALPDQDFTLRVQAAVDAPADSGLPITGPLRGGRLEALLPPGTVRAFLTLEKTGWFACELAIGGLDPTHEPVGEPKLFAKGIQQRLHNLGFRCGALDGWIGPKTMAALQRFQADVMGRTDPDGKLDDATREALVAEHGC